MKHQSTYRAARKVAPTVEQHFTRHLHTARQRGEQHLAAEPSASMIETIIDTAFWASLRREEGRPPKISLAFLAPHQTGSPLLFKERLPLTSAILTKLAPGVERPSVHLGVWYEQDQLYVWGTTLQIPNFCFVLDVSEPGLLVVKYRRKHGFGKFVNVAVLIGDQIKVVDEGQASLPDCPPLLTSLLGTHYAESHTSQKQEPVLPPSVAAATSTSINVLVQLSVSMRNHQHGGALLIVPARSEQWQQSMVHPIRYAVMPAFCGLADLMRMPEGERNQSSWQAALRQEVDSLAGLTAVDGATVINDAYELLAFGAKIGRAEHGRPVEQILITEPVIGSQAQIVHPAQSGGTRHLSAAQFVHDQRDAMVLVASQDGRFTVFSWSPCENMVQAHRIDTLLL